VRFHGLRARADVLRHLAQADVLVLPSEYEGLSHALLEAAAAGLACVASDRGGNPEIIEHGRSGLLWPYGHVDALRETLARLARDEDLRLTLARGAKARSAAFDFRETVARTIEQLGA
jgi:glycosyltransferase involved in cell wall biosynthesis